MAALQIPNDKIGIVPCRHGPMAYPRADTIIGRSLELYGEYSEDEVRLFAGLVKSGDTVIDAGANIGALTVPLAHMVGASGRVLAFEPQRQIHALLSTNIVLNGLENVMAERMALGQAVGETFIPNHSLGEARNFGGVGVGIGSGQACPVTSIDALGLPALRLLKIDVEGFEHQVLEGAEETLRRLRPLLYVENDRRDLAPALIRHLLDRGYRLWWHLALLFSSSNFRGNADNVFGPMGSANMLCLPSEMPVQISLEEIVAPDQPLPF
jgi:FkbM family methyltransferase